MMIIMSVHHHHHHHHQHHFIIIITVLIIIIFFVIVLIYHYCRHPCLFCVRFKCPVKGCRPVPPTSGFSCGFGATVPLVLVSLVSFG